MEPNGSTEQNDDAAMRVSGALDGVQDAQLDPAAEPEPVTSPPPDTPLQGEEEKRPNRWDSSAASAAAHARWEKERARRDAGHDAQPMPSTGSTPSTGDRTVEPSAPAAGRIAVLTDLMHNAKLPSDRIRAAEALRREEEEELAGNTDRASVFLAQRAMLEALPPHDRLAWLREERGRKDEGDAPDLLDWMEWDEAGPADVPTGGHPRAANGGTPADS